MEAAVRYVKSGCWPTRSLGTLAERDEQYADWRDWVAHPRRHATGQFIRF